MSALWHIFVCTSVLYVCVFRTIRVWYILYEYAFLLLAFTFSTYPFLQCAISTMVFGASAGLLG